MSNRTKRASLDSSEEDEVKILKLPIIELNDTDSDSDQPLVTSATCHGQRRHSITDDALHKYSMEKCEFCESIFHTRYDHFVHNVEHLAVTLERYPILKCLHCNNHFTSQQELHHHTLTVHIGNIPDIIASIVKNDPLVKNVKSMKELKTKKNGLLESIVEKTPVVKCDDSVKELIKGANDKNFFKNNQNVIKIGKNIIKNDILESIVQKTPVIRCDDTITELIKVNNDKGFEKDNVIKNDMPERKKNNQNVIKMGKNIINNDILESIVQKTPVIRCDDTITELIKVNNDKGFEKDNAIKNDMPERKKNNQNVIKMGKNIINNDILKSIVQKTPVIRCHDAITELIKVNNDKGFEKDNVIRKDKNVIKNDMPERIAKKTRLTQYNDSMMIMHESNYEDSNETAKINQSDVKFDDKLELFKANTTNIRSRLIFEDDSEDDDLFNNVVDSFRNGFNKRDRDEPQPIMGKIMLGTRAEKSFDSIHYEDLLKPGLFFCKHCKKSFPSRFKTYIHEISHIRIKQRRPQVCHHCDRYIAGNYKTLNQHIARQHSDSNKKKHKANSCEKCGFKFHNYSKHSQLYHYKGNAYDSDGMEHEDSRKEGSFDNLRVDEEKDSLRANVEWKMDVFPEVKLIKVCEVCSMFLKNSAHLKYVVNGEVSQVGERQRCERCWKKFFEVKLVRVVRREKMKKMKDKKEKKEVKDVRKWGEKCEDKSNKHRLKNIQHRLKMLNKLSRFYGFRFFFNSCPPAWS